MAEEMHGWRRQAIVLTGAVMTGTAGALAVPYLTSPRGAIGPTVLQSESPLTAALATLICLALALAIALAVGRLTNAVSALGVLGWFAVVVAHRAAEMDEVLYSEGSLALAAVETLVWAALVLGMAAALFKACGPLRDAHPRELETRLDPAWSGPGIAALVCGAVVLVCVRYSTLPPARAVCSRRALSAFATPKAPICPPHPDPARTSWRN